MSADNTETNGKAASVVTKTISMPDDLFALADPRVAKLQEGNWSRYVRDLIRRDLEKSQPAAAAPVESLVSQA